MIKVLCVDVNCAHFRLRSSKRLWLYIWMSIAMSLNNIQLPYLFIWWSCQWFFVAVCFPLFLFFAGSSICISAIDLYRSFYRIGLTSWLATTHVDCHKTCDPLISLYCLEPNTKSSKLWTNSATIPYVFRANVDFQVLPTPYRLTRIIATKFHTLCHAADSVKRAIFPRILDLIYWCWDGWCFESGWSTLKKMYCQIFNEAHCQNWHFYWLFEINVKWCWAREYESLFRLMILPFPPIISITLFAMHAKHCS